MFLFGKKDVIYCVIFISSEIGVVLLFNAMLYFVQNNPCNIFTIDYLTTTNISWYLEYSHDPSWYAVLISWRSHWLTTRETLASRWCKCRPYQVGSIWNFDWPILSEPTRAFWESSFVSQVLDSSCPMLNSVRVVRDCLLLLRTPVHVCYIQHLDIGKDYSWGTFPTLGFQCTFLYMVTVI